MPKKGLVVLLFVRPVEDQANISEENPRFGAIECIVSTGTKDGSGKPVRINVLKLLTITYFIKKECVLLERTSWY